MSLLVWTWAPEVQAQVNPHCCEQFFLTKPAGFTEQKSVPCVQGSLTGPQSRSPRNRTVPHQAKPHTFLVPGGCTFQLLSGDISVFVGCLKTGPICAFSSTMDSTPLCIFRDEAAIPPLGWWDTALGVIHTPAPQMSWSIPSTSG